MKKMKRVIMIVLDGCGIGELPDAASFGDKGADTLGHVLAQEKPDLPNMSTLGLGNIRGWKAYADEEPIGCYGKMAEVAPGKDTTTGHWELAGLQLKKPFPTYPNGFPDEVIRAFEEETGMSVIGNKPASGTAIIDSEEYNVEQSLGVQILPDSIYLLAPKRF